MASPQASARVLAGSLLIDRARSAAQISRGGRVTGPIYSARVPNASNFHAPIKVAEGATQALHSRRLNRPVIACGNRWHRDRHSGERRGRSRREQQLTSKMNCLSGLANRPTSRSPNRIARRVTGTRNAFHRTRHKRVVNKSHTGSCATTLVWCHLATTDRK